VENINQVYDYLKSKMEGKIYEGSYYKHIEEEEKIEKHLKEMMSYFAKALNTEVVSNSVQILPMYRPDIASVTTFDTNNYCWYRILIDSRKDKEGQYKMVIKVLRETERDFEKVEFILDADDKDRSLEEIEKRLREF
jgi:hypothetical protein